MIATTGAKKTVNVAPFVTEEKDTTKRYCIQCKYHSSISDNEHHATDKMGTALKKYKCEKFITVSSSDFSSGEKENIILMKGKIIGINGRQLSTLINKALKKTNVWDYVWPKEDLEKIYRKCK